MKHLSLDVLGQHKIIKCDLEALACFTDQFLTLTYPTFQKSLCGMSLEKIYADRVP